ncbi:MAG: ROK family protein [Chloroflexi bacterium]|nr:ROK family protein [Chloroflexota bacterium]
MTERFFLGLDFGGTKLAVGLVDGADGQVLARAQQPTPPAGADASIDAVVAMAQRVWLAADVEPGRVAGAGISFGGPVDAAHGVVLLSHHAPGWEHMPLTRVLGERLGLPTCLDNDANVQALGEARCGAGRGARVVLYLTVSTGIGGGIVVDGRIYRGAHGLAGEIGHTIVQPNGPVCTCGKRGCLESVAAGPAIARAAARALVEAPGQGAILRELLTRDREAEERANRGEEGRGEERHGEYLQAVAERPEKGVALRQRAAAGEPLTAALVFEAARAGDALANRVVDEAIGWLAIGIANAVNVVDPDIVVLGGGVSRAGERLFSPLRAAIAGMCAPADPAAVRLEPAALGDDVGIVGAASLFG